MLLQACCWPDCPTTVAESGYAKRSHVCLTLLTCGMAHRKVCYTKYHACHQPVNVSTVLQTLWACCGPIRLQAGVMSTLCLPACRGFRTSLVSVSTCAHATSLIWCTLRTLCWLAHRMSGTSSTCRHQQRAWLKMAHLPRRCLSCWVSHRPCVDQGCACFVCERCDSTNPCY